MLARSRPTLFIDTSLLEAGWGLTEERDRELRVTGMPNREGVGFADDVHCCATAARLAPLGSLDEPHQPVDPTAGKLEHRQVRATAVVQAVVA